MPSKLTEQPAPEISGETKLLSIDAETNGLHGEAFAVGAVLIKLDGTVLEEYLARCPIDGEVDSWVRENVIPPMKSVAQTHESVKAMRDDFWQWYKQAKEQADYVLVDNGYPVEARFLIKCQEDNLDERYWEHPFPLLELASLLIQVGIKPLAVRHQLVADQIGEEILQHSPRWDAWVSALAAIKALKLSGRLS